MKDLGKSKDAELSYRKAIEIKPDYAEAQSNLGIILRDLGKLKDAELSYRKAIEIRPDYAEAHYNLGNALRDLGKLKDAELSYINAIKIKPDFATAHFNLGNILRDLGRLDDAINQYKQALKLNNELSLAKTALITTRGQLCHWSDEGTHNIWLRSLGIKGQYISPLGLFYYEDDPLKQLKIAKKLYKEKYYKQSKEIAAFTNEKIHIGYFSADFRDHPVMQLIAPLLELHDKSRFEIYLYSFVEIEDKNTERAKNSGCFFRNIKNLSDIEAAQLARRDKLDIAVDLMGYTANNRMPLFSYRVAPIQINYLGYPGTTGSDTIDYIIADKIVIPNNYEKFYTEKILRMPNCYLTNDDNIKIDKDPITREDFNLPKEGFIFTCFNNNKKITPNEFDIWMRLLIKIKGSVLWLKQPNKWAVNNLNIEAEKRNVDPKRLIFANKVPLNLHLARHALGDLGLDTFNYNGHTTTADALWAGLPVLTKIGASFAARVSASLLTSIGLPELITYSESEYEEKALYIASNHEEIHRLKSKLKKLKETSTLYNSELFTRDLETKYIELVNSHHSCLG